jgi:hypothetical protein
MDHANARFGLRVQSLGLLAGAGLGDCPDPAALTDVVHQASFRIQDHARVRFGAPVGAAVVAEAVEPLAMATAELLDNAARHSDPDTLVTVETRAGKGGATIVIDDSGPGMTAEQLQRASDLLGGRQPVSLSRLDDPPQYGLAVVGLLSARYGFRAFVGAQSPGGGVRAIIHLPAELLVGQVEEQAAAESTSDGAAEPPQWAIDDLARPMGQFVKDIGLPTRNPLDPGSWTLSPTDTSGIAGIPAVSGNGEEKQAS